MKNFRNVIAVITLGAMSCHLSLFAAEAVKETPKNAPTTKVEMHSATLSPEDMKQLSKTFGHFIGKNLKAPGINLDLDLIIEGIRDGAAGKPAPMTDQEFEKKMALLQAQAFSKLSEENLKAANEFLEKNKSAKGIIVLEPGKLQYEIMQEGKGETVTAESTPLINYKGSYLNGTVFGNSQDSGGPIAIPLSQTVPGFSKGITGMKEGEKRKLFIHPDLGYGANGALQPNALLVFEVEVVKANQKAAEGQDDDNDDDDDDDDDSAKPANGKK